MIQTLIPFNLLKFSRGPISIQLKWYCNICAMNSVSFTIPTHPTISTEIQCKNIKGDPKQKKCLKQKVLILPPATSAW